MASSSRDCFPGPDSDQRRDKALVVPAAAVFQIRRGLEKVFVIESGRVSERIVRSVERRRMLR